MKYTAEEELILKTLSFYEEMDFAKIVLDLDANEIKNFPELNRERIEAILKQLEAKKVVLIYENKGEKNYKRILNSNANKFDRVKICLILFLLLATFWVMKNENNIMSKLAEKELQFEKERYSEFKGSLNSIRNSTREFNLFIGASGWERFLNPRSFDQVFYQNNLKGKSYNLAFGGMMGNPMLAISEDLATLFPERKVNIIFVELPLLSYSKHFLNRRRLNLNYILPQIFLSENSEKNYFLSNSVNHILGKWIVPNFYFEFKNYSTVRSKNVQTISIEEAWGRSEFQNSKKWDLDAQGLVEWEHGFAQKDFMKLYEVFHEKREWENQILKYQKSFNLNESFVVDMDALVQFEKAIINFKKISNKVVVVLSPVYYELLKNIPSFEVFKNMYIKKLKNDLIVVVADYSYFESKNSLSFFDPIHLRERYVSNYVVDLAENLKNEH